MVITIVAYEGYSYATIVDIDSLKIKSNATFYLMDLRQAFISTNYFSPFVSSFISSKNRSASLYKYDDTTN